MSSVWERAGRIEALAAEMEDCALALRVGAVELTSDQWNALVHAVLRLGGAANDNEAISATRLEGLGLHCATCGATYPAEHNLERHR